MQSLQITSEEAKTVVLRDVILPAAGIALASYLTIKVAGYILSGPSQEPEAEASFTQEPLQPASPKTAPQIRRSPPRASKPKQPFYQSLFSLGSLLIPAGQAIMEVIQEERAK